VIVEGKSGEELLYREAESYLSAHHKTCKHQCTRLGSVLNLNSQASSPALKAVLRLRIAATSMPEYVSGCCRHGYEPLLQPFLLTYSEADLSL